MGRVVIPFFYDCVHSDLSTHTWTPVLRANIDIFRSWTYTCQRVLRQLLKFDVQFASFPARFPSIPIFSDLEFDCLTAATQSKLYGFSDCFGKLFILLKAGRQLGLQSVQQNPIIYLWRQQTWAPSCKDLNVPPPLSYTDLIRVFVCRLRNALLPFDRFTEQGKLLVYITLKRLLGFECSNFRLFCIIFGFEITSCAIFELQGIANNKEGLCLSIGAMCAFCRNCVEIVNARMKSNNKLTIRVNFSCVCRLPDVLHVMLKPFSGIVDYNRNYIEMVDLCSGSPDLKTLDCLFEFCSDNIRIVTPNLAFQTKLPTPHISEAIKYGSMANTETYKRFMSLWAYKYLPYRIDVPESFRLIDFNETSVKDSNIPKHMLVSMALCKLNPQFKAGVVVASSDDSTSILDKVFLQGKIGEELYCFCLFVIQFYQKRMHTKSFYNDKLCNYTKADFSPAPSPRFNDPSNALIPNPWLNNSVVVYNLSKSIPLQDEIETLICDSTQLKAFLTRLFVKEHSFLGTSHCALEMTSKLRWCLFQKFQTHIDEVESRYNCKICYSEQAVWCATPCGHVVSCNNCHTTCQTGNNRNYIARCSQCRAAIRRWVRLYT